MYFIGVTTGSSSIMRVFPEWARHLGLHAVLEGVDLPLHAAPERYREVVGFIRDDPQSLGALVTTHKLDLLKASRELFDELGEDAELLGEVSSISKSDRRLVGHAKDPVTSGLALEAIVPDGYWSGGAELAILGAGGSSLALTLHLHRRQADGLDVPRAARGDEPRRGPARRDAGHPPPARVRDPCGLRPRTRAGRQRRRDRRPGARVGRDQRHRPRKGSPRLAADRRGGAPSRRHRVGLQLPRRPRLPAAGRAPARRPLAADRRRLGLLHPRLDQRHRRGLRRRHPDGGTGVRTPVRDRSQRLRA